MIDDASLSLPPDIRALVHRRLVGLVVLLLAAFLLSLLLRSRPKDPDALPSVVIALNQNNAATAPTLPLTTAPTLDALQPEPEPARPKALASAAVVAAPPAPASNPPSAKPAPVIAAPIKKAPPKIEPTPAKSAPTKPASAKPKAAEPQRWYVAAGAYKDPVAAKAIGARIKLAGFKVDMAAVGSGGSRLNRVRAGPFASRTAAESARAALIVEGLTKSVVVSEK